MSETPTSPEAPAQKATEKTAKTPEEMSREELVASHKRLEEKNEKLRQEALTDHLTGVYNLRGFEEFGRRYHSHAERTGEHYAMFMLDIDKFKTFNDEYGHSTGDYVLRSVADALTATLRDTDIVARVGGDEFAGLLVGYETEEFNAIRKRVSENLQTFVDESLSNEEGFKEVGFSMGFAFWSKEQGESASYEDLMEKADKNMYEIKKEKV